MTTYRPAVLLVPLVVLCAGLLLGCTVAPASSRPGPTATAPPAPTAPAVSPTPLPTSPPEVAPGMLTAYAHGVVGVVRHFRAVDATCRRGIDAVTGGRRGTAIHTLDVCAAGLQAVMNQVSNLSPSVQVQDFQTNLTVALNNAGLDAQEMSDGVRTHNRRAVRRAARDYRVSYADFMDTIQEQASVIQACAHAARVHSPALHGSLSGCDEVPSTW